MAFVTGEVRGVKMRFFWQWKKDEEQVFAVGDMKLGDMKFGKQSKEFYSGRVQICFSVTDDVIYWWLIIVSLN